MRIPLQTFNLLNLLEKVFKDYLYACSQKKAFSRKKKKNLMTIPSYIKLLNCWVQYFTEKTRVGIRSGVVKWKYKKIDMLFVILQGALKNHNHSWSNSHSWHTSRYVFMFFNHDLARAIGLSWQSPGQTFWLFTFLLSQP